MLTESLKGQEAKGSLPPDFPHRMAHTDGQVTIFTRAAPKFSTPWSCKASLSSRGQHAWKHKYWPLARVDFCVHFSDRRCWDCTNETSAPQSGHPLVWMESPWKAGARCTHRSLPTYSTRNLWIRVPGMIFWKLEVLQLLSIQDLKKRLLVFSE